MAEPNTGTTTPPATGSTTPPSTSTSTSPLGAQTLGAGNITQKDIDIGIPRGLEGNKNLQDITNQLKTTTDPNVYNQLVLLKQQEINRVSAEMAGTPGSPNYSTAYTTPEVKTQVAQAAKNIATATTSIPVYAKGGIDAFNLAKQQGKITDPNAVYVPPKPGEDATKWGYLTEKQTRDYINQLVQKGAIVNITKDIDFKNPDLYTLLQNLDKSFAAEHGAALSSVSAIPGAISGNQINVTAALAGGATPYQLGLLGVSKDTIGQAQLSMRTAAATPAIAPSTPAVVSVPTSTITNLDKVISDINSYNVDQSTKDYLITLAQQGNITGLNLAINNINQGIDFRNKEQAQAAVNSLNVSQGTKNYLMAIANKGDWEGFTAALTNTSGIASFKALQTLIPARTDQTQNTNVLDYKGSYDPKVIATLGLSNTQLKSMGFSPDDIKIIKTSAPQVATITTSASTLPVSKSTAGMEALALAAGVAPKPTSVPSVVSGRTTVTGQVGNLGLQLPTFSPVTPRPPTMSKITDWIMSAEPKGVQTGVGYGFGFGFNILGKALTEGTAPVLSYQPTTSPTVAKTLASFNPLYSGSYESTYYLPKPETGKLPSLGQLLGAPETRIALMSPGIPGGIAPLVPTTVSETQLLANLARLSVEDRALALAKNPSLVPAWEKYSAAQKAAEEAFKLTPEGKLKYAPPPSEAYIPPQPTLGGGGFVTPVKSYSVMYRPEPTGLPSWLSIPTAPKTTAGVSSAITSPISRTLIAIPTVVSPAAALAPAAAIAAPSVATFGSIQDVPAYAVTPAVTPSVVTQQVVAPTITPSVTTAPAVKTTPILMPIVSPTVSTAPRFAPTVSTIIPATPLVTPVKTSIAPATMPSTIPATIGVSIPSTVPATMQQTIPAPTPASVSVVTPAPTPAPEVVTSTITAPAQIAAPIVAPATLNNILGISGTGREAFTPSAPPPVLPKYPSLFFPQLRSTAGTSGGGGYGISRQKKLRKLTTTVPETIIELPKGIKIGGISDILGTAETKILTPRREKVVAPKVRFKAGATEAAGGGSVPTSYYRGRAITNRNISLGSKYG